VLAVLVGIAASLVLAACGGSSPASSAASNEQSNEETRAADFAKCLREHGINAESTVGPGGGGGLKVTPDKAGGGPQQMEAAQKACQRYQPKARRVNLSPQQKIEQEEAVQKFAKCMREHGIKVETSTAGGGVQIRTHVQAGAEGGPNPESPAFQSAQQACQKLLPLKGGGPRTGGPPSTSKSGSTSGQPGGPALSAGG
jgi:ABC-type glycerol-3-phosphate transport system substrate-binding protein